MRYTVTVEDPKAYTRPWTTSYIYRMRPGVEIMEYWCTENERDAQHMVGKYSGTNAGSVLGAGRAT